MHNRWKIVILLLMIVSLMSGCFGKKEVLEPLQPSKIKVIYQTEEAFDLDYGKYFKMNYPQIEVEVIPKIQVLKNLGKMIIPDEYDSEVRKLLERSGADVLLLDQQNFEQFAANGKLYGIDEAIRQDNYDIKGFMPGLIDVIKNLGDGKLYGLTPAVYNKALRYNTALFRENQIDPPTNKMTWREVFELGARFSNIKHGDRPVRGVFLDDLRGVGDLMYDIAKTYGLQLFDPKGEKVLINSKGWKEAMSLATDAVRNNVVYFDPVAQLDSSKNLFDDGVAAMTFKGVPHAGEVGFNTDKAPVEWEAVTVPIDPADESTGVYLDSLFAIAADSSNKRAAWEFVKFVCGPEMAHARSKTMDGTLPSRTGYVKEFKGKSMEAFYMLKVKQADSIRQSGRVPFKFFTLFDEPLREELQAVVDNKKSVDEAAVVLEAKAQELLIQARAASGKKP
ncbi:extracellular solute-binding protein [Paenibacillus alvei]|uniref:Extracellular solute-binding protein n=1 Tax=Paenibacillus alvei TaxID=44250 RepID=A0ABT4E8L2_PAEAL|nr:extracellular solute-binding protein [Paenibacillus alvei]MCY9530085.1 extracellular solute-binding protein [Paenibacillus alvei]